LPQKSDFSFTPGFSPVITGQRDSGTVSTVFFLPQVTEAFECAEVMAWRETVETVRYVCTAE
jgi:hypothetical protein